MSNVWVHQGYVDVRQDYKENSQPSTGSAFSWRGKKITILHVKNNYRSNMQHTNPFSTKGNVNTSTATTNTANTVTAYTTATNNKISPSIREHPIGKELDTELDTETSDFLNDLDIDSNEEKISGDNNNEESNNMPPLIQSEEPELPPSSSNYSATAPIPNTKGVKKKKLSVSFSDDMNTTRTFDRVKDVDKSKLWYSQAEAKKQKEEARYESRDISRIGLVNSETQTSPMIQYGSNDNINNINSRGTSGLSRREEVAKMRGRVTTGRIHWKRGKTVSKIDFFNQVEMPNDPVSRELGARGYRDDGTGRYRKHKPSYRRY